MRPYHRYRWLPGLIVFCLLWLVSASCGQAPTTVEALPETTSVVDVPDGVVAAREALLGFLRTSANQCVPPEGVRWLPTLGKTAEGFAVYRFNADDCLMTVAYAVDEPAPTYHVALHDHATGFCYQANVSGHNEVIATGTAAGLMPELAEVAAAYCRDQGYEHAVEQQADGSSCGVCRFPDGSSCKAWLFLQDACGPASAGGAEP